MSHCCKISECTTCIERDNQLFIKNCLQLEGEVKIIEIPVKFCPECLYQIPKENPFNFLFFPYQYENPIEKWNFELQKCIQQMNENIENIKAFMVSQNIQNEIMIQRHNELVKRVSELENKKIERMGFYPT